MVGQTADRDETLSGFKGATVLFAYLYLGILLFEVGFWECSDFWEMGLFVVMDFVIAGEEC